MFQGIFGDYDMEKYGMSLLFHVINLVAVYLNKKNGSVRFYGMTYYCYWISIKFYSCIKIQAFSVRSPVTIYTAWSYTT